MSWTQKLYETYDNNVGLYGNERKPLVPISHMNANIQIELTINVNGDYVNARIIKKDEAVTPIPVNEKSASRSSGIAPHPLSDTLSYIAGDYKLYCADLKDKEKAIDKHKSYMDELSKWEESDYGHPKLTAIRKYLEKDCLINDLIQSELIISENGKLANKKIEGTSYEKVMIRFRVIGAGDGECVWKDNSLIEAYSSYYSSLHSSQKSICYITGKEAIISQNHPKGIVAANYGAKLMSSNDNSGFTYRGRFIGSEDAYGVSYEASQKIHAALTWLAANQGNVQHGRTYICWNPNRKVTPDIFNLFAIDDIEGSLNADYKKKLKDIINGYKESFDDEDEIIFIGLDAATTGRLSITYYNEQSASMFMESISYWADTFRWHFIKFNEAKKPLWETQTPPFWRVINCAFGTERNERLETDDRVFKEQIQRLIKCLLDRQPFPNDIVITLTRRASQPAQYLWKNGHSRNWEQVLSICCAAIIKFRIDHNIIKKEEIEKAMKLDVINTNRSYLFGRLLAVFEKIERSSYADEGREPNAIRLQAAFVNHPMQTWKTMDQILLPYFQKLKPGSREYYRRMISDITGLFREEDAGRMNQPLQEDYLLGYFLQRGELNKKSDSETKEEE